MKFKWWWIYSKFNHHLDRLSLVDHLQKPLKLKIVYFAFMETRDPPRRTYKCFRTPKVQFPRIKDHRRLQPNGPWNRNFHHVFTEIISSAINFGTRAWSSCRSDLVRHVFNRHKLPKGHQNKCIYDHWECLLALLFHLSHRKNAADSVASRGALNLPLLEIPPNRQDSFGPETKGKHAEDIAWLQSSNFCQCFAGICVNFHVLLRYSVIWEDS